MDCFIAAKAVYTNANTNANAIICYALLRLRLRLRLTLILILILVLTLMLTLILTLTQGRRSFGPRHRRRHDAGDALEGSGQYLTVWCSVAEEIQ